MLNTGAQAWHDETHLAMAKVARYNKWYDAAGADMAKEKAGNIEARNHYSNIDVALRITPEMVVEQANRYNDPDDGEGHLYGAILASFREYVKSKKEGKYAQYPLAYCAHYVGDLSQPNHNTPLDDFSKLYHVKNDGIVEVEVLRNIEKIKRTIHPITLRSGYWEEDLAKEIARTANAARALEGKLRKENRPLTPEEAYRQLGESASLFKAMLDVLRK